MPDLRLPKKRIIEMDAPLWKRLIAFLLDLMIVLVIIGPLLRVYASMLPIDPDAGVMEATAAVEQIMADESFVARTDNLNFFMTAIAFLYFFIFELKLHKTPGKMAFGMEVMPAEPKQRIRWWQFAVRNLFVMMSFVLMIDLVYYIFRKQRLSDILAKTRVVQRLSA